jgi:hypothetical protein
MKLRVSNYFRFILNGDHADGRFDKMADSIGRGVRHHHHPPKIHLRI